MTAKLLQEFFSGGVASTDLSTSGGAKRTPQSIYPLCARWNTGFASRMMTAGCAGRAYRRLEEIPEQRRRLGSPTAE